MRTPTRQALSGVFLVAALAALTGCGGEDDDPTGDASLEEVAEEVADEQMDSGIPEECTKVFPYAWGTPDLDDADLLPTGWPAPPAGATLCNADGGTVSVQTIEYAREGTDAALLDHYEESLNGIAGIDFSRETRAELGREVIMGTSGEVGFEIEPRDGGYRILLSAS